MIHDHLIGWFSATHLTIAADLEPERESPRVLWEESLLPPGVQVKVNPFFNGIRLMPNQRNPRNPLLIQNAWHSGLAAITDSAVLYYRGGKLFAADPLTGELVWSRKDYPGERSQIYADDRRVAVTDAGITEQGRSTLALLRIVDGRELERVAPPTGILAMLGGSRVLRSEDPSQPAAGPVPLELADLATGERLWTAELARPALIRVWNQSEIFVLEENRTLSVRNVADGAVRWKQELSLEAEPETLLVQPWRDRYLVIAAHTSPRPVQPGSARVSRFTSDGVELTGRVMALDQKTGELLWAETVEDTAFDVAQPAGWPILLFAGRLHVQPRQGAVPVAPYVTRTLIDKRTGKVLSSVEEQSNIHMYSVDAEPERNRIWVNFGGWSRVFRYTRPEE
jgi:hypothetical protein